MDSSALRTRPCWHRTLGQRDNWTDVLKTKWPPPRRHKNIHTRNVETTNIKLETSNIKLEKLLNRMGREWCLRQASNPNFSVLWPWPLIYWPPKLIVSSPCPVDQLFQFVAKSVHSFSNYRQYRVHGRTDGRTNGPVRNIMPPASLN